MQATFFLSRRLKVSLSYFVCLYKRHHGLKCYINDDVHVAYNVDVMLTILLKDAIYFICSYTLSVGSGYLKDVAE